MGYYVYEVVDPISGVVVYVGRTTDVRRLNRRIERHPRRRRWVAAHGVKPLVRIVGGGSDAVTRNLEQSRVTTHRFLDSIFHGRGGPAA